MTDSPKPTVVIRPARPEDCDIIVKMIHELAVYERAPEQCHATTDSMRAQLFGERPTAEALVTEINGEVGAYAIFFHNFSTWESAPGLYIEDIYVRPTFRRGGIGKMLIMALAGIAVKRGCRRFEWSVLDWNKPARDFYESLGARPQTEWVIYRTEGEALHALAREAPAIAETTSTPTSLLPVGDAPTLEIGLDEVVTVHTDGGARPNPGTGAWAAILRVGGRVMPITGGEYDTTNNRMELMAAIRSLEMLPHDSPCRVELHTDSQYVRNGITSWIAKWRRNGWRATSGPVKNEDLWRRLDELSNFHYVSWHWIAGHSGDLDNEECDRLCAETIDRLEKARS